MSSGKWETVGKPSKIPKKGVPNNGALKSKKFDPGLMLTIEKAGTYLLIILSDNGNFRVV